MFTQACLKRVWEKTHWQWLEARRSVVKGGVCPVLTLEMWIGPGRAVPTRMGWSYIPCAPTQLLGGPVYPPVLVGPSCSGSYFTNMGRLWGGGGGFGPPPPPRTSCLATRLCSKHCFLENFKGICTKHETRTSKTVDHAQKLQSAHFHETDWFSAAADLIDNRPTKKLHCLTCFRLQLEALRFTAIADDACVADRVSIPVICSVLINCKRHALDRVSF